MAVVKKTVQELYKLNNNDMAKILPEKDLLMLFTLTSSSLLAQDRVHLPKYMSQLIQYYTKRLDSLPPAVIVQLVVLGSKMNRFEVVLRSLLANKANHLNSDFTAELLKYYNSKNKLNLDLFEQIHTCVTDSGADILDDRFYQSLINYIESLFKDNYPKTHEYKDLERNLDRIQLLVSLCILKLNFESVSTGTSLSLLKLAYDLSTSVNNPHAQECIDNLLLHLVSGRNKETKFQNIRNELFKQNLEDEDMAEALLALSWSNSQLKEFATMLTEFIQGDDVKFSLKLRTQCKFYELLTSSESESIIADLVISTVDGLNNSEIDYNDMFTCIMQCLKSSAVSPRGYVTQTITNHFVSTYNIEPSLYSYKYRLDSAIANNDYVKAVNIFEDSILHFAPWSSAKDPAIQKTLNDLIVVLCKNIDNVDEIFPIFTKIKQQMVNSQCNVDAIFYLSRRMLQAEYVGDVIELLKRELPNINKDSKQKLPTEKPYGLKYKNLFESLHTFVTTYEKEETHETNWVLYGELHKYFNVPFESYLPAMKFFCEHGRLNAALIVLRQVKKLNELHGDHHNLPPLRDMYMYLFQEFGDKLYEEGVIEVHEYLKMDVDIQKQDIALQNSILNAYSNLQDVPRARDLFLAMATNPKHINEETIQIMIKTYTYNDLAYVQKFFNNLSVYNIIPNYSIFRQYLIAHVYHGLVDDALKLTEEMPDYDLEVSKDTLLSLHNYCLETKHQQVVAQWAEENHKEKWNEVKVSGLLKGATNYVPDSNLIAESSAV